MKTEQLIEELKQQIAQQNQQIAQLQEQLFDALEEIMVITAIRDEEIMRGQ